MDDLLKKIDTLSTNMAKSFFATTQMINALTVHTERYYDGSHSRFVSEKSFAVAVEIGLSKREAMETKIAGLLHDIGKVGFSDTTLFKQPLEMTGEEQRHYLMHPEMGYNVLMENENYKRIAPIVLQHHERLDGSGFPRHLKSGDILTGAKIIAVVDYFHNAVFKLTRSKASSAKYANYSSTASYLEQTGSNFSGAINYLQKKAGQLYDQDIVDSFTHIIQNERKDITSKTVLRVPYPQLTPGMILAEDYKTKFGMLIAAKGETITKDMISAMRRFVNAGDLPNKILVMK